MNSTLTHRSTAVDAAAALPQHDKTISSTRVTARTRRRTPLLLATAGAVAATMPLLGATPAQAATLKDPNVDSGSVSALAASGCRAAPYSFSFSGYGALAFPEDPTGQWNYSTTPVLKTTTQCVDINVKNTTKGKIRVCVMFGKTSTTCNYQTTIAAGAWANAATNVKDNTYFRMRLGILYNTAGYAGGASGVADF
ncbi:hypothetical protein [Actinoplanes sp. NPDC051851]|uniref:hypothetical protein n=1 Tax=Actinoplanes sp. NPDC051851 TaxID=3154753 RepID=UPI00342C501F